MEQDKHPLCGGREFETRSNSPDTAQVCAMSPQNTPMTLSVFYYNSLPIYLIASNHSTLLAHPLPEKNTLEEFTPREVIP